MPGACINLGNGEASAPVHNDRYDFSDEAIPYCAVFTEVDREQPRTALVISCYGGFLAAFIRRRKITLVDECVNRDCLIKLQDSSPMD